MPIAQTALDGARITMGADAHQTVAGKALTPLEAAVARVRGSHDFPAVAGRIQQLMTVLGGADPNVQDLAKVIVQDYSLTVKLLRVANSFRFNRSSAPVISPTHAIVMMGAEAVRDIAATLVVWEHFSRRCPAVRPLLMLSLLSANHARELAITLGTVASEEAYLLGMLRNLGEVLVACYMPEQYAAVLKDVAERQAAPAIACRRVLHFEYEELGRAVVQDWGMPESVSRTMTDLSSGPDELHTVVSFAHRLTGAVYRQNPDTSSQAVRLLIQKYGSLQLSREEVTAMLEAAIEGTRETFALAGVKLNDLQLKQQMLAAVSDPGATPKVAGGATPMPKAAATGAASQGTAAAPAQAAGALESKLANRTPEVELDDIIRGLLAQTVQEGSFNRAVLAMVQPRRRELCGRVGAGKADEKFVKRFRFPVGLSGGPLGMAASRGQELTLARTWELLPEEHRLLQGLDAGTILMVPVMRDGKTIGVLYVDTPRTVHVGDEGLGIVREMRDRIAKALERHRDAAA